MTPMANLWEETPRPMTEAEALALLRQAARPWRRLMCYPWRPTERALMAAWRRHEDVAARLGYCHQPGCEKPSEGRFCAAHTLSYTSPHPTDKDGFRR